MIKTLFQIISPHPTLHQQSFMSMETQQQQPAYMQFQGTVTTQYPTTTAVANGHSQEMTVSPITTSQSAIPNTQAIVPQSRITGAVSMGMGTSAMYGEENGFTDLFNAAAVAATSDDTLLMGKSAPVLSPILSERPSFLQYYESNIFWKISIIHN